jgi:hypothetical protein
MGRLLVSFVAICLAVSLAARFASVAARHSAQNFDVEHSMDVTILAQGATRTQKSDPALRTPKGMIGYDFATCEKPVFAGVLGLNYYSQGLYEKLLAGRLSGYSAHLAYFDKTIPPDGWLSINRLWLETWVQSRMGETDYVPVRSVIVVFMPRDCMASLRIDLSKVLLKQQG